VAVGCSLLVLTGSFLILFGRIRILGDVDDVPLPDGDFIPGEIS
jgi:hypothetical protein